MSIVAWVICSLPSLLGTVAVAQIKYDPEHPEVRQMVRSGVGYLKSQMGRTWGERVLNGLAQLSSFDDHGFRQDPQINDAVLAVLDQIPRFAAALNDGFAGHNLRMVNPEDKVMYRMYEPCIGLMLLAEYDDVAFDHQIRTLIDFIVRRQNQFGGWSYNNDPNSDVSQTQYCCLALWLAHQKGFDIPLDHSIKAVDFWVQHQFHDGTWAYHPIPNQPAGSSQVSLAAAGAGSLYMLGDILGVNPARRRLRVRGSGAGIADLPAFVERLTQREVDDLLAAQTNQAEATVELEINVKGLNAAKQRINTWFGTSFHTDTSHWPYYALYGFERYATFREMIDGEVTEVPDWYDQGVEYIKRTQRADGSVNSGGEGGPAVHTALAVLFLVRSTQRLTNRPQYAALRADVGLGRGVMMRNGEIIHEEERRDITELLNLVKDDMSPDELADIASSFRNAAVFSIKDRSRSQQLMMLKEMVKNQHWQIRMVAVRALGQVRMIDNCPALIFALTDPNPMVVQEARIALQFVSRKTETPAVPKVNLVDGEPDTNSDDYKQGIRELYDYWSRWYRELKPDACLLPVHFD